MITKSKRNTKLAPTLKYIIVLLHIISYKVCASFTVCNRKLKIADIDS